MCTVTKLSPNPRYLLKTDHKKYLFLIHLSDYNEIKQLFGTIPNECICVRGDSNSNLLDVMTIMPQPPMHRAFSFFRLVESSSPNFMNKFIPSKNLINHSTINFF